MKRELLIICLLAPFMTLCGCSTDPDYARAMKTLDEWGYPKPSNSSWRLFQDQDVLWDLYVRQLDLNRNDSATIRAFCRVWEEWDDFAYAELEYCKRVVKADLEPPDIYKALCLSDLNRRNMSWGLFTSMYWRYFDLLRLPCPDGELSGYVRRYKEFHKRISEYERIHMSNSSEMFGEDEPPFKKEYVQYLQNEVLKNVQPILGLEEKASYAAQLRNAGISELDASIKAYDEEDYFNAFHYAADAMISIKSAITLDIIEHAGSNGGRQAIGGKSSQTEP